MMQTLSKYLTDSTDLPAERSDGLYSSLFMTHSSQLLVDDVVEVGTFAEPAVYWHHTCLPPSGNYFLKGGSKPTARKAKVTDSGHFWAMTDIFHAPQLHTINASWIFSAHNSTDDNSQSLVGKTIDGVNELIGQGQFSVLNLALDGCPETAGRYVLLTLARACYPVRSRLVSWQSFLRKVESEFIRRGLDSATLLKGLAA